MEEGSESDASWIETVEVRSLLGGVFSSVEEALDDDRSQGLDLLSLVRPLDFHESVCVVNFARTRAPVDVPALVTAIQNREFDDPRYLIPVIPDDPLLTCLDDDEEESTIDERATLQANARAVRDALEYDTPSEALKKAAAYEDDGDVVEDDADAMPVRALKRDINAARAHLRIVKQRAVDLLGKFDE